MFPSRIEGFLDAIAYSAQTLLKAFPLVLQLTFPVKSQKACSEGIVEKAQHTRYTN
jgi:hypothetical protein